MISLSLLLVGSLLGNLGIGIIIVAAFAVAAVAIQLFFRARDARQSTSAADQSTTALHALGAKIETLVGEQQLQGETHRQILAQKIDAIGQRFDEQRSAVDGLRNEVRHESRRRDAELEEIRHQIATIQQQVAPALASAAPLAALPPHPPEVASELEPVRDPEPAATAPQQDAAPPLTHDAPSLSLSAGDGAATRSATPPSLPAGDLSKEAAPHADSSPLDPFAFDTLPLEAFDASQPAAEPDGPDEPAPLDDWGLVDTWQDAPGEATSETDAEPAPDAPSEPVPDWTLAPTPDAPDPFASVFAAPQAPGGADPAHEPADAPAPSAFDPWEVITPAPEPAPAAETGPSAQEPVAPEAPAPSFDTVDLSAFDTPSFAPAAPAAPARPEPVHPPSTPRSATPWKEPAVASAALFDTGVPGDSAWVARGPRVDPEPEPAAAPAAPVAEPAASDAPAPPFEAPEGADVLTVITSVDDDLQRALYQAGVTSLDEIARWGRGDARRFATSLGVAEDLIMGQWVFEAQAALFSQYARQAS